MNKDIFTIFMFLNLKKGDDSASQVLILLGGEDGSTDDDGKFQFLM